MDHRQQLIQPCSSGPSSIYPWSARTRVLLRTVAWYPATDTRTTGHDDGVWLATWLVHPPSREFPTRGSINQSIISLEKMKALDSLTLTEEENQGSNRVHTHSVFSSVVKLLRNPCAYLFYLLPFFTFFRTLLTTYVVNRYSKTKHSA